MRLILASQSPSRRMLLHNGGVNPVIHPANIGEEAVLSATEGTPADKVAALARAKADTVAPHYPDDIVVGCDSMLLLDGTLQGKPHTIDATMARWQAQRGKSAQLLTGHAVGFHGQWLNETVSTTVHFGEVSDNDIEAYARSGEPLECAGAFTLEALGSWFIDKIEGDPTSVIGLSMPLVRRALYSFGVNASDLWES